MDISRIIPVLLSLVLVNCLHHAAGQSTFAFIPVISQTEDISVELCMRVVSSGSNPVDTTLTVSVNPEPTTAGPEDFSPQSATLFWTQADVIATNTKCFPVNVTDDEVVELNERIGMHVVARDPSNTIISNIEEFGITDNDVAIVSFRNETGISVSKSVGSISICVNLTGPAGGLEKEITITIGDREGTAIKSQDYFITPSDPLQVTFTSGTPQGGLACGVIHINNKTSVDVDKDFQMFLDPVAITDAIVVEPMVINITISNDDGIPEPSISKSIDHDPQCNHYTPLCKQRRLDIICQARKQRNVFTPRCDGIL